MPWYVQWGDTLLSASAADWAGVGQAALNSPGELAGVRVAKLLSARLAGGLEWGKGTGRPA